jgi:hypothetical protein
MKCNEFQKQMYRYHEMTSTERSLLSDHVAQCRDCSKLMDQVVTANSLVSKARGFKPEVKNPERMTQQIMNAISLQQKSPLDKLLVYFDNYFVRYSISLVSLFLIGFFIYEQNTVSTLPIKTLSSQPLSGTRLDMKDFLDTYRKRREDKSESNNSRYTYYKSQTTKAKF